MNIDNIYHLVVEMISSSASDKKRQKYEAMNCDRDADAVFAARNNNNNAIDLCLEHFELAADLLRKKFIIKRKLFR